MTSSLAIAVHLFTLIVYALTMFACVFRGLRTRDARARIGNVAFGWLAGVAWLSQAAYVNNPPTPFTWLLLAGTVPCLLYLITLARKGL